MADFNSSKVDGDSVDANEWNQLASIDNFITTSGQTPSTSNLNQMGIAAARYSSGGQFFTDSGTANAYVLTSISAFKSPVSSGAGEGYFVGMTIKIRAGNPNTGASTVNVNSAGVKNLKKEDGTTDLDAGDISTTNDITFRYNGTSFVRVLEKNPLFSNKNAIINGDFNIWQRGTSFVSVANDVYSADRWRYSKVSTTALHDISRSTDVPTFVQSGRLFNYSMLVDCQTADAAVGSTDYVAMIQSIEGYNFLPLAQKSFTISFWVKATKMGVYCMGFVNSGLNRSYVAEYTVNASDAWEYKTVTISASPSAGTWDYTNGAGLYVVFTLMCGSARQTTAGTWQTGEFEATSNQVNACDSTSNNFRITGVQLEAGSVATPFQNRTIQEELALCQRYFEKSWDYGTAIGTAEETMCVFSQVNPADLTLACFQIGFKAAKRTTPTIVVYDPLSANTTGKFREGATQRTVSAINYGENTINRLYSTIAMTSGAFVRFHYTASAEI